MMLCCYYINYNISNCASISKFSNKIFSIIVKLYMVITMPRLLIFSQKLFEIKECLDFSFNWDNLGELHEIV